MTEETINELIGLLQRVDSSEGGYLLSSIRHAVHIPGNLLIQKEIQFNLEQLTYGLLVVYLFAIFEDYITLDIIKQKHPQISKYLAYRHIRHSFAHKISGNRAKLHRSEFENMYRDGGFGNTITWDIQNDTITINSALIQDIKHFLINSSAMIYSN